MRKANKDKPELVFTQEGDDLVVSTTVTANNSPHVLWTHVVVTGGIVLPPGGRIEDAKPRTTISLQYCVIQNRDWFVRSTKEVQITWRIPRQKKAGARFRAYEVFTPTSKEMKALLPQLQALTGKRFGY